MVWKFCIFEKVHFFLHFFPNPQISFLIKSISVGQVLTKIFQIDRKLTFNIFHILNHGRISKIEKISDGTDPPQKRLFWGGCTIKYFFQFWRYDHDSKYEKH